MRIHLITHAQDQTEAIGRYMIAPVLNHLVETGHQVTVFRGIPAERPAADIAILHVDLTRVPLEYTEFAASYAKCLNITATDISKRAISGAVIRPDTGWDGPVLIKGDLNYCGIPEVRAGLIARQPNAGTGLNPSSFAAYNSLREVPPAVLENPDLVIERFIPERDGDLYVTRFWSFLGDGERCTRNFSSEPIVKSFNQTRFEYCEVPEQLRQRREELGFDFGKFDFVMHEGQPVLIDANKTPGRPPVSGQTTWQIEFADALLKLAV